ncbi:MAG: chalcone isomerase family protein [Candidatus Thiodiazotropha sp.]
MKSLTGILGLLLMLCLVTLSVNARVNPLTHYPSFQAVGSGVLTWWGIGIYQATLYAPQGEYGPDQPHALEIVYRKNISRKQLAKTSIKEIEKIRGRPLPDRDGVLGRFEAVFRDVSPGDTLLGIHLPGEGARFYTSTDYLGLIDDPDLAAAFFDIWLSPATTKPKLRAALLGQTQ